MYNYWAELNGDIRSQQARERAIMGINEWRFKDRGSADPAKSSWESISYAIMDGLGLSRKEVTNYLANI